MGCLICRKPFDLETDEEVCCNCTTFFRWKYKEDYEMALKRILDFLEINYALGTTKLKEVKKCQKKKVS